MRPPTGGPGSRLRLLVPAALGAALIAALVVVTVRRQGQPPPSAGGGPLPRVEDVGARLGLPQEEFSFGIAAGDLTGDDAPELLISYHGELRVYRLAEDGLQEVFRPRLGDAHDCAIADVDGDGRGDIYCTRGGGHRKGPGFTKTNGLWLQQPDGTFSDNVAQELGTADPLGRGRRTTFLDADGDGRPDLFVGNQTERTDQLPSPNRLFLNRGDRFVEARAGLTREVGGNCVQAVDVDLDGRQDLVVCGEDRMFVFRNEEGDGGKPRFRDVTTAMGLDPTAVRSAWIADLDGDGAMDIAVVREDRLEVRLGDGDRFGRAVIDRPLRAGAWITVGDVDGRQGPDLYVVQACADRGNVDDRLLLNRGEGRFRPEPIPQAGGGCGDVATAVDLDGDGRDEVVVLNGSHQPADTPGPVQVLTVSPSLAR